MLKACPKLALTHLPSDQAPEDCLNHSGVEENLLKQINVYSLHPAENATAPSRGVQDGLLQINDLCEE